MADNPFKKILEAGLSFIKKSQTRTESVVGIDIGASSIKVVQLKKKAGKAVLETYGELSLGPYVENIATPADGGVSTEGGASTRGEVGELANLSNDKLAQAIADVLKESEITTRDAAMSIPASASLIFTVEIPSQVTEKDLATIVPTEARKYIPVPINEVSLDWWAIPKKEESESSAAESAETEVKEAVMSKTEVLVAAIHNDTMKKYKEVSEQAHLEADTFEIEVWSNIRSTFGYEISAVLLVDFGASKTKLAIVDRGIIRSFHIINRGSVDISNGISKSMNVPFARAEELKREVGLAGTDDKKDVSEIALLSVGYIFSEANSVVLNYEKKENKAISKVILSGGGSLLKGFITAAGENFQCEVILADPFDKTEAPVFLSNILKSVGPEFSVATGLALRKLK